MYPNDDLEQQLTAAKPPTAEPPLHFRERLKARLLAQYSVEHRVQQPSGRFPRPLMIAVPLLVMVLMGLIAWFGNTSVVSAAEIVDRASQVFSGSNTFGLQSYKGVMFSWFRKYYALESSAPLRMTQQTHVWAQGAKVRYEYYDVIDSDEPSILEDAFVPREVVPQSTALPTEEQTRSLFRTLRIIDDTDDWTYNVEPSSVIAHTVNKPGAPVKDDPTNLQSLLAMLSRDNDQVKLTGSAVVAGRDVYVLRYTPKPDVPSMPMLASVVSYIDKQGYIPLKVEYFNAKDLLLTKWEYVSFEANPQLDPSLFVFTVPSNVQFQDLRITRLLTHDQFIQAWQVIAESVGFTVLVPAYIPEGLAADKPLVNTAQREDKTPFFMVEQEFYPQIPTRGAFRISQWPESKLGTAPGLTIVQIGDTKGNYTDFAGSHLLTFVRDGTMIQLSAALRDFTKEELIQIAESMYVMERPASPEPK